MTEDKPGTLSRRTMRGAIWMVGWRMATRLLGLASTLILARILVPADFGLVAMATVLSAAIDSISAIGLLDALVRRSENDRGLFDPAFSMQALRGFATAAITALAAWPASLWFHEPRLFQIMLVLAATSIVSGFENIAIVEFRRGMRFDKEFKLLVVPRICQVIVTVSLAVTLHSYWALVAGLVVVKLLRLAMTYVMHPYRPRFALARWRELLGFSFWTWMSGLASLVWDRADPVIIGPVLGPALLGVYLVAAEIAILPITELVAPAAAALYAGVARASDRGGTIGMAFSIASVLLMVIVPLAIAISGTSGYLVAAMLGSKWAAAQPLIAIFAVACIFAPFAYVCTTVLLAEGHVRQNFQVVVLSAVAKIALLSGATLLTHRVDIIALLSVCTNLLESTLFLLQLRRLSDTRWRASLGGLFRITIAGAVTIVLLHHSGYGWSSPGPIEGRVALLVGGLVGLATIAIFAASQLGLWLVAGRPEGPESRMLALTGPFARRWVR